MIKFEKLDEINFHVWKQKIENIIVFKEIESHICGPSSLSLLYSDNEEL